MDRSCLYSPLTHTVYTKLYKATHWALTEGSGSLKNKSESVHGAVFNIEFSPLNDIALTVCSNRAILSYDPRMCSSKPIHTVRNAHDEAVNCLTFIDPLLFATCSDDKTIRIWDMRNFKHSFAVLQGHKNWVKNIEYDPRSCLLFSIAFHDGVREWDMNHMTEYTEEECLNLVFKMADPVRMRISPTGDKMFISERDNVCWVINDFNGLTIKDISRAVSGFRQSQSSDSDKNGYFESLVSNRPSMYIMSGLRSRNAYRSVMSSVFFPCGEFIALRHMDVKSNRLQAENLALFDLRQDTYKTKYTARECEEKYRMYIDENSLSESSEFIKEISVSKDGRLIASPYGTGARLLAVDPEATPPDVYFDDRFHSSLKQLHVEELETLQTVGGHNKSVLSCKFANNDLLLGTGCLEGHVLFHRPQL